MRRATTFVIGAAALFVLAAAVISSSRAIAPRADESASPENAGLGRSNIPDPLAASSSPQCPSCLKPMEMSENFDGVIPPALPTPHWVATNVQGPPPLWITSNSGVPEPPADTMPNAASIDDPSVISDKLLDFCCVTIFEACCGQLTFRQNFNLEASDQDPTLGFDGGVLELSTDGGNTFQDILDAGGSFVIGGYNRTISTDRGSPIAGRRAWSGNSGGFTTTVVDLPGLLVPYGVLRWRMASDNTGSAEGWRVDTVDVTWCQGGPSCTPTPTATARVIPSPRPRPTPPPRPTPR
jgi:hypothetical protein